MDTKQFSFIIFILFNFIFSLKASAIGVNSDIPIIILNEAEDNLSNGNVVVGQSLTETQTINNMNEEEFYSGDGELTLDVSTYQTTIIDDNDITTTISNNQDVEEEQQQTTLATITNILPKCSMNESLPDSLNCSKYYQCTVYANGTNEATALECPTNLAFSSQLKRCTRDLQDCTDDGFSCNQTGTFAMVNDNTTYWMCSPSLINGYHKFLVKCPTNQFYYPDINGCFYDLMSLPTTIPMEVGPKDIDVVKAELKQFKLDEKLRLKAEKLKIKLEKEYQKLLAKQAKKELKEKEKLAKQEMDMEMETESEEEDL